MTTGHVSLHHWPERRLVSHITAASSPFPAFPRWTQYFENLSYSVPRSLVYLTHKFMSTPTEPKMPLGVLCNRSFGSEQALEQHRQNSPIHTRTVHCEFCNRFFGSEQALKQHQESSPVHTGTYCKACNRSFGSNNALKQHQHDSPVHQQLSKIASSTVIPTFNLDSSLLPYDARAQMRQRNSRQSPKTPSNNTSDLESRRNRPSQMPENYPRVFTISIREPIIKPSQVPTVHVPKRKEETRTSFMFPELHDRIAEAVSPEVSSIWFQSSDRQGYNNEHLTCVVGSFTCDNQTCKKRSWVSGVVSILMRGYARNGYSAVVFNQRCKSCEQLGTFTMDEISYVERIAYRIEKWAGVWVDRPFYNMDAKGPHEERLCEGCKRGTCPYTKYSGPTP